LDSTIKIAALPLNISWCNYEENLLNVAEQLATLQPDTDVVVLPELFTTGFINDKSTAINIARSATDVTLAAIRSWCNMRNIAIAGSFLALDGNRLYNRAFFIEPSGDATFYDKHHLFCLGNENDIISAGQQLSPIVRFRSWNFALAVCYDLRFPAWCRNQNQDYDALIIPANWPETRDYAWRHLLIARAIENQALVVGANRSGIDDFGSYGDMTLILDPLGKPLASTQPVADGQPAVEFVYATYSKSQLDKVRTHLPFGNDADKFTIHL
jgi:predicted amidohydrolase